MEYYLPNNYTENKTVVVSDWNYQNENVTFDTMQSKIDTLIGQAPELLEDLNSLRELADGINNDPLFYSKVVTTSTAQTISGTKTFSDPVIFNGNVTVGNSTADILTVTSGATLINLKTTGNTVLGDIGGGDSTNINGNITLTPLTGARLHIVGETRIAGANISPYHGAITAIGNGSLINWNGDGANGVTSFISGGSGSQKGFEFLQYDSAGSYQNMGLKIKSDGNAIMNDISCSNITVSGSSTINGAVTLGDDSLLDTMTVNAIETHNGASMFNNSVTFNGNVTVGNSTADILTVTSGATLINLKTTGNTVLGDIGGTDWLDVYGNINFTPLTGTRFNIIGETKISGANSGTYHGQITPIGNGSLINWQSDGSSGITSFVSGGNGSQRGFEFLQYGTTGNYLNMGLKIKSDGNAIMNDISCSNITVSGASTINGAVTLGDDSLLDTMTVNAIETHNGASMFNNSVTFNGNVNIGNSTTDILTVTSGATLINLNTTGNTVLGDVGGGDSTSINGNISFTPLTGARLNIIGETRIAGANISPYHGAITAIGNGSIINWNGDGANGVTSFISGGNGSQKGYEFLQYDSTGSYQNMGLKIKSDGNSIMNDISCSNITVSGASTFDGVSTFKNNVIIGDLSSDVLTVNATTSFLSPVSFVGSLTLADIILDGLTTVNGNANFKNNVTIGDVATDVLMVNSVGTFNETVNFKGHLNILDNKLLTCENFINKTFRCYDDLAGIVTSTKNNLGDICSISVDNTYNKIINVVAPVSLVISGTSSSSGAFGFTSTPVYSLAGISVIIYRNGIEFNNNVAVTFSKTPFPIEQYYHINLSSAFSVESYIGYIKFSFSTADDNATTIYTAKATFNSTTPTLYVLNSSVTGEVRTSSIKNTSTAYVSRPYLPFKITESYTYDATSVHKAIHLNTIVLNNDGKGIVVNQEKENFMISPSQLKYLTNITSDLQSQLNSKVTNSTSTTSSFIRAIESDVITTISQSSGDITAEDLTVTATINTIPIATFAFIDGLTSNVQAQLESATSRLLNIEAVVDVNQQLELGALTINLASVTSEVDNLLIWKTEKDEYDTAQDLTIDTFHTAQTAINSGVETSLATHTTNINLLVSADITHVDRLTSIETKNTVQDGRLDAIETLDITQSADIATNASSISTINTTLASHTTSLSSHTLDITGLTNSVADIYSTKQNLIAINSRLNANLIGTGNISNIEYETLDNIQGNIQEQLDARLTNATLSGVCVAPTAADTTNTTQLATCQFVKTQIGILLGGATNSALDTILELGNQLTADGNAITAITGSLSLKAPIDSPNFTTNVTVPALTLNGSITSNAQTITTEQLGYVAGVTSNIQSQLTSKLPSANPSTTGLLTCENISISGTTNFIGQTITGLTKSHVGLSNVDNVASATILTTAQSQSNTWSNTTNSFLYLPTCSTTATLSSQLTNKTYVDSAVAVKASDADVVKLSGIQSISGVKTLTSPPVMSGASIQANTIAFGSVNGLQTALDTKATVAGTNSFSGACKFTSVTSLSENITAVTTASSVATCDYSTAAVFIITNGSAANFALALTNVNSLSLTYKTFVVTLIINSSVNKNYANSLTVNGTARTILYNGGSAGLPVLTSATQIVQTFSIIYGASSTVPVAVISNVSAMYA
jgi:hypothetical protein